MIQSGTFTDRGSEEAVNRCGRPRYKIAPDVVATEVLKNVSRFEYTVIAHERIAAAGGKKKGPDRDRDIYDVLDAAHVDSRG